MKALVAVKRVVGFNVKDRVKADATGVETANSPDCGYVPMGDLIEVLPALTPTTG